MTTSEFQIGRLAILIPVLNEAASLAQLIPEIQDVMQSSEVQYDIFVIDDGSNDRSAAVAQEKGAEVLRSIRNRGKSAALQAGFDATRHCDVVITIDGDLQDDPREIPRMLEALESADVVSGWKADRQDSWARRQQSRVFTWAVRRMTSIDLHDFNCGFKAYRRPVLDAIRLNGDQHRLIPVLAVEAGYTVTEIPVNHRPRVHGRSRFGLNRVLRGPLDLITVLFLSHYGRRPLHVFGAAGLLLGGVGFLFGLYLTWLRLQGESIGDRPLLLLAVLMMLGGLQLFAVGLLGEMMLVKTRSKHSSPFHRASVSDHPGSELAAQSPLLSKSTPQSTLPPDGQSAESA